MYMWWIDGRRCVVKRISLRNSMIFTHLLSGFTLNFGLFHLNSNGRLDECRKSLLHRPKLPKLFQSETWTKFTFVLSRFSLSRSKWFNVSSIFRLHLYSMVVRFQSQNSLCPTNKRREKNIIWKAIHRGIFVYRLYANQTKNSLNLITTKKTTRKIKINSCRFHSFTSRENNTHTQTHSHKNKCLVIYLLNLSTIICDQPGSIRLDSRAREPFSWLIIYFHHVSIRSSLCCMLPVKFIRLLFPICFFLLSTIFCR